MTNLAQKSKNQILVDQIKMIITHLIYESDAQLKVNFSDYLASKIDYAYTYMSQTFYKLEGSSIQQFMIQTRIQRAKDLLDENKHTLTSISDMLYYSSVAHLSNQFKKIVGVNPSTYLLTKDKSA